MQNKDYCTCLTIAMILSFMCPTKQAIGILWFISHSGSFGYQVFLAQFSNPVVILLCMPSPMRDIVKKIFTFFGAWRSGWGGRDSYVWHFEKEKPRFQRGWKISINVPWKWGTNTFKVLCENSQENETPQKFQMFMSGGGRRG